MVNLCCAFILARVRDHHGSLTKAAFFRRGTTCWPTSRSSSLAGDRLPLAIGVARPDRGHRIAIMNADAAREIWSAAHEERRNAELSCFHGRLRAGFKLSCSAKIPTLVNQLNKRRNMHRNAEWNT